MHPKKHDELSAFKVEEDAYMTRLTKKFRNRMVWEPPNASEVHSYIPGMVIRLFVQEGQRLQGGASILTFEAMKMENTFTMPCDGVVKKINVKVGEVFAKDVVLVEIEPD